MEIRFSLDQIEAVAKKIYEQEISKIVLLNGEMGVGKTTLIKQLCKIIGVTDTISSPTFSLVNEYLTAKNQIAYHFDFYRLKTEDEALDIGIDEYFNSGNWCFIEWSEKIPNLIPKVHTVINLEWIDDKSRLLKISKHSQ